MRAPARLLFPAVLAAAALACGEDSTAPDEWPTRAQLTGAYGCAAARVFYARPVPPTNEIRAAWRLGSCAQYVELTNPSLELEMDTTLFFITSDDRIRRVIDWPAGEVSYDQSTGTLVASYPGGETVTYLAEPDLRLIQTMPPDDYTGDGMIDSVELTFVQVD